MDLNLGCNLKMSFSEGKKWGGLDFLFFQGVCEGCDMLEVPMHFFYCLSSIEPFRDPLSETLFPSFYSIDQFFVVFF